MIHLNDLEGMARTRMQDNERKIMRRALVREALATLPQKEHRAFWQRFGRPAGESRKAKAPTLQGVPHSR